ncbi:MAG: GrpB family protein [Devosia sp.]
MHVVEFGGESWASNLAFRDALRSDAGLRDAYLRVKQAAAAAAPDSRGRYNELKQEFIAEAKRQAIGG